ncbi:hypothetical protein LXT21_41695 [Myxococcus sp. K38C18041901]|uniref:hypothetical protein n=1 Tax=Myxococcus guangdongensis TaxID=2906760 RepID=UPI0020A74D8C|nr:hypothetical protein [Myxococcus guangdongensis]MCP3065306.1 hypothetical protein [Myxococcus guangdongensis]
MSTGLKFESGLAPVIITMPEGTVTRPCVFRRAGLAIACEEGHYSITHEASGCWLAPVLTDGTHALVLVAALLSLPLDWTKGIDDLRAPMSALSNRDMATLHCIHAGRTQFVDMGKAGAS